MTDLVHERTKSCYAIELPVYDFMVMCAAEESYRIPYEESLSALLEGIGAGRTVKAKVEGVSGVEYEGHFGAAIYYMVDEEDDTVALHDQVKDLIIAQIARARSVSS